MNPSHTDKYNEPERPGGFIPETGHWTHFSPGSKHSENALLTPDSHSEWDDLALCAEVDTSQRLLIWNSQEDYIKACLGGKVRYANYGWGSSCSDMGVAESTKVYSDDGLYILSSHMLFSNPGVIAHELHKL